MFAVWVLFAIVTSALPIPLLKYYTQTKDVKWIALAIVSHLLLTVSYIHLLANTNMECIYAFIKTASILAVATASIVLFETQVQRHAVLGIVFACISLYFLSLSMATTKSV
jgi:multidrug transporter EmrE-like cation transporter